MSVFTYCPFYYLFFPLLSPSPACFLAYYYSILPSPTLSFSILAVFMLPSPCVLLFSSSLLLFSTRVFSFYHYSLFFFFRLRLLITPLVMTYCRWAWNSVSVLLPYALFCHHFLSSLLLTFIFSSSSSHFYPLSPLFHRIIGFLFKFSLIFFIFT